MSDSGIKIELHLIQNFAPSNLNRDDTGQPKSATFGGSRRARISSQCSKRNARLLWRERGSASVGERTKLLKQELAPRLTAEGRSGEQMWASSITESVFETRSEPSFRKRMWASRPSLTAMTAASSASAVGRSLFEAVDTRYKNRSDPSTESSCDRVGD